MVKTDGGHAPQAARPVRVLVVDDSALVREVLRRELGKVPGLEVVGVAGDPYVARELLLARAPDVLTLDLELPRMDGLSFLRRLMAHRPTPVVVFSSLTPAGSAVALEALRAGAVEVIGKPAGEAPLVEVVERLAAVLIAAAASRPRALEGAPQPLRCATLARTTDRVIAVGASTGGTVAIERLLGALPAHAPGVVIAQHMPETFTRQFAERLAQVTGRAAAEATDGAEVVPGTVLVAPGNHHLVVRRSGAHYVAQVKEGPRVNGHRPSVDVLFRSVAASAGANAVGVLLTGMGADGAQGLLALREAGAHTVAQDEATSVVYGMPRAAAEAGAACEVLPIDAIAPAIVTALERGADGRG